MLSWACTIHKLQGLSLNKIVISCDLLKQKSFNPGQINVALSHVTSLEGLFLIGRILCNVRSLRKHVEDIRTEQRFISSDLNLYTETQLLNEDYNEDLYIENFSFLCNISCDDRFRSLAIYFKSHLKVHQDLKLNYYCFIEVKIYQ